MAKKVCKRVEKGGAHGEEGTRQSSEAENVVRIPRDWFGPKEDLVPFGPSASQTSSVQPAEVGVEGRESRLRPVAGRNAAPTSSPSRAPLDPNTFWGEDSSLIQDVVAAPAEASDEPGAGAPPAAGRRGISLPALPARLRLDRGLIGALRAKPVAVAACFCLILIASVVAWQLAGAPPRTFRASIASVARDRGQALVGSSEHRKIEWPVRHLAKTTPSSRVRRRPRITRRTGVTHSSNRHHAPKAPLAPSGPTEVTYHSSQPTPSPTTTSYQAASTPNRSTSESATTRASSTPNVASAAATHSPPAAFGTSGVLGPMSSPDG